jgi:hypothetical protein
VALRYDMDGRVLEAARKTRLPNGHRAVVFR